MEYVWVVEEIVKIDRVGGVDLFLCHTEDSCVMGVYSSKKQALDFLKRAIADKNSGFDLDTPICISKEKIDSYFEVIEEIDWKTIREWLEDV